jgi:predicted pyridoxine 5'-phosphate oxidase superfamily flavin-nucleotide-binding protein
MGSVIPQIDDRLREWIARQPMFFVATAPSGDDGHVNVSPKGGVGTLAVLGPHEVAYADWVGSGIETTAHLRDNGRIVLMLCAFEGPPTIIRLHGRGETLTSDDARFGELLARLDPTPETLPMIRGIVRVDVERISDSCGFTVPRMAFRSERRQLHRWADARIRKGGADAMREYCDANNAESIDGLPALPPSGRGLSDERRAELAHDGRKL